MKRFSTLALGVLCLVALGLGGYAVYANLTASMSMHNNVIFNAPDDVFFRADVRVAYQGEHQGVIGFASLNKTGSANTGQSTENGITFKDPIGFTRDKGEIVYEVTITNHTEKPIAFSITPPQSNEYVNFSVDKDIISIDAKQYTNDGFGNNIVVTDKETITITATRLTSQFSFQFDSTFTINLQAQQG